MEKRKGRPRVENPKNKRINFPVTEAEYKQAQEITAKLNLTYSQVFFKGLEYWSKK